MDLEGITLSEISQTEEDKYSMMSPIPQILYIWNKKKGSQIQKTDWWLPEAGEKGQKKWMKGVKV